jgi:hypothetical protein
MIQGLTGVRFEGVKKKRHIMERKSSQIQVVLLFWNQIP